ncbi:hypothetical protein KP509_26G007100 [Ceratopteris richardii]|uniref:Uncharacterized protein n=2 Tax=Ceratopteris richardii TaxID=49495 RepID=A0A8T2RI33_CERRI|nr:hypothetical protein KP509_26G007100 [Ceratopteris richardii]
MEASRNNLSCTSSRPLLFALNGRRVEIASPDPSMTLLTFLRSHARLTGTKLGCGEGGCGACLVLLASYDPISKQVQESSINSCLALLCSVDGCAITTIEGLGSTQTGFHSIQKRMAGFHASQCGYCTPGMCISLYSTLRNSCGHHSPKPNHASYSEVPTSECSAAPYRDENGDHEPHKPQHVIPTLTSEDAQKAIIGNICRCTGYRPILDACKSFAGDVDVEDLGINSFWPSSREGKIELLPPYSGISDTSFPDFLIKELDYRESGRKTFACDQSAAVNGFSNPGNALDLKVTFRDGDSGVERVWVQTSSLNSVFEALQSDQAKGEAKLVVGNTSSGYYKDENPRILIDIGRIPELLVLKEVSGSLIVGAAVSIGRLIDALEVMISRSTDKNTAPADGSVAHGLASHMRKVANPHVRHRASVGGNLIMAQQFHFDSDLVPLFLAVGATTHIITSGGKSQTLSMEEFLQIGLLQHGWILESITLPLHEYSGWGNTWTDTGSESKQRHPGSKACYFRSYRAAPRNLGNALAHLNAAFFASISHSSNCCTILDLKLAFGAFGGSHAVRVHKVESFLSGKVLSPRTLIEAIDLLKRELQPSLRMSKKASYKLSLAVDYFSSFFSPLLESAFTGTPGIENGLSSNVEGKSNILSQNDEITKERTCFSGKQIVPSLEEDHLIHKAMEKTEARIQAAGEAVYVDDIPSPDQCLFAAFVGCTKAAAKIKKIDPNRALSSVGVIAFISAKDIPEGGANVGAFAFGAFENLFADYFSEYVGHPVGVVVADTTEHAQAAARLVEIEYDVEALPIVCIEDAVAKGSLFSVPPFASKVSIGNVEQGFSEAAYQVSDAEVRTGSQYYFYMETQTALAIPDEDNCIVVYNSCQSTDLLQKSLSTCLGIPHHNVRIITRRVGGGFGGKASRNIVVANACALAAFKLRRPVRMYLDRKTDMFMMGGRHPTKTSYTVGFKSDGKVTGLRAKIFMDGGWSEDLSPFLPIAVTNSLKKYDWGSLDLEYVVCKTNLSSKSAMRGPGHLQGSFIADSIIEHVACTLGLDVHTVITRNMHSLDSASLYFSDADMVGGVQSFTLPIMWNSMLSRMEEKRKEVDIFNAANVWLKKGLSVIPCIYEVEQNSKPAKVSIYHDGSIVVEVGGIELGQGLWTKVKQATVHGLKPLITPGTVASSIKVRVVQADSISLAHGGITSSSTTSEGSCEAVRQACQILVERLLPIKLEKEKGSTSSLAWNDLIHVAQYQQVNLTAHVHWFPRRSTANYLNYGVAATQVEVDTLTGSVKILESNIIYDCGRSINPAVDIGQIEGAFVQGIGFFLTEEIEVNDKGELLNTGTWTYKPPTIDNIPQKFVVEMLNAGTHENRILSSKACGEPPLLLAGSVHSAVKRAIEAARAGACAGEPDSKNGRFFQLDPPASMERVKNLCGLERMEDYLKAKAAVTV